MTFTLAIDGMGGDDAPEIVVKGIALAAKRHPDVHFLLYGDQSVLSPLLAKHEKITVTTIHTSEVVTADMKPSAALRGARNSSMRLAIDAVARGEAQGVVSAGNTGAYMALAKIVLKTLEGIDRPAIAGLVPTLKGRRIMLDLGANTECTSQNLVQFAVMGVIYARLLLEIESPLVGLLNVGSEELKGNAAVKEAAALLKESVFNNNFYGYIEGDAIHKGVVDVVVTDGFTGNVSLKTIEGTAKLAFSWLQSVFTSNIFMKLVGLMARPAFKALKKSMDHRHYNGALFLGLNGVAVKSHGGIDEVGFANAIDVAANLVRSSINQKISEALKLKNGSILSQGNVAN